MACIRWIFVVVLLAARTPAWAFPTSANLIPTADLLEAGSLRLEVENDGAPRLLGPAAESYLLLEYAPTPRFELGADLYSAGAGNDLVANAKWLLQAESRRRPALAVGLMEVGVGFSPTGYVVATKDLAHGLRVHFGAAASGAEKSSLLGLEQQVSEQDYLLADYATWPAGYLSLGLYHELRPGLAVSLAYALPNAADESRLLLLNVAHTQAVW